MSAQDRFEELWVDHAPAVLRYARRRVAPDDVDDVVAETFVVAWRRIEEVPAFALPWLLGVARHVSANSRRSGARRDALRDRLVERIGAAPGHDVVSDPRDDSAAGAAGVALNQLPGADRELLMLIAWDGLTSQEAALALGCSRSTLAVRLHRARRRFAALLERASARPPDGVPAARQPARVTTQPTGGSW